MREEKIRRRAGIAIVMKTAICTGHDSAICTQYKVTDSLV